MNKLTLRLIPSVRRAVEAFCQKEGVSLNHFINVAVAEKLARLQQEKWQARRPKASSDSIAKALQILTRPTRHLISTDDWEGLQGGPKLPVHGVTSLVARHE